MKQEVLKNIATENGTTTFQVRLLKDEGVGLLTTQNDENYLILDSIEYWYDVIQSGYPKKKKCSCKNEWFKIQFDYLPRPETEDIKEIQIITTCTVCNKISKASSINIDYSPTNELIEKPITFCEQPNIKYKFKELTSYWSGDNLKDFLKFIFLDLKLNVYCWFWQHSDKSRHFEKVSIEKAIQIITVNHNFLNFYFSANEINTIVYTQTTDNNGVYIEEGIWRKDEIIQLSSPLRIVGYGLLYCIKYCNQYIDKGNTVDKSVNFEKITNDLNSWLTQHFITKRGKNCFDGQEAYEKLIKK